MSVLTRSRLRRAVAVAGGGGLVAGGVVLAAAGPASAQALSCGSTVSSSVTLTANINCTTDTTTSALTITAPGVTVNLNGHSILGPGASASTEGVVDDGNSDVTVENGTITDFLVGADIEGSSTGDLIGVSVHNVTVNLSAPQSGTSAAPADGVVGVFLDGASIQYVRAVNLGFGVDLESSQDSTITRDHITDALGVGIGDFEGQGNTISANTFTHAFDSGIEVDESAGDVVHANTLTKFCDDGISFFQSGGLSVTGNTLDDCYMGIADEGNTGANTVSGNHGSGNLWGLYAQDVTGETYRGNTFTGGQYGIETDCPASETLTRNTTNRNSQAGVFVFTGSPCDPTLTYSAKLAGNTANYNRFGLYSQIATTGTGNHAAHNKAVNCFNVHCTRAAATAGPAVAGPPHHQPVIARPALPARP